MKYIVSQDLKKNRFFSSLILFFNFNALVFILCNLFYEKFKWGLLPAEILTNILGNEDTFISPMSLQSLVTNIHIELFLYLFLLIMACSVFFRIHTLDKAKTITVGVSFISLLINEMSPFLIFNAVTSASYLKFASFWCFQVSVFSILLLNSIYLINSPKQK